MDRSQFKVYIPTIQVAIFVQIDWDSIEWTRNDEISMIVEHVWWSKWFWPFTARGTTVIWWWRGNRFRPFERWSERGVWTSVRSMHEFTDVSKHFLGEGCPAITAKSWSRTIIVVTYFTHGVSLIVWMSLLTVRNWEQVLWTEVSPARSRVKV